MTSYPHEDAAQLGHKKSEDMYKEWARYWQAVMVENRTGGVVDITQGGNIIFVGHAAILDMTVIALNRLANPRSDHPYYQLSKNLLRVPYCALGAMRDRPFQVVSPPCPPAINSSSGRFDWRILLNLQSNDVI